MKSVLILGLLCWALVPARAEENRAAKLQLTPQQKEQYKQSLSTPTIKAIRTFLNTYHDKSASAALPPEEVGVLSEHKPEESKGRFVVAASQGFLLGGELVMIVFQDKPNLILRVWVKDEKVKSVFASKLSPEATKDLMDTLTEFLKVPEFGA